ncbi:hypothetical protein B566_EDAN013962, partial [Ephemera danica]
MAATCSGVLLALLLHSVVAVRYIDRLSCPVIACYRSSELRNCKFNNSSDIECTMYSVSRAESKILPVKSILEYRTVFYLQQSSPIKTCLPSHREENSFCLGIRSTLLRIVDDIPEPKDEANQFTFPDDITQNLKIAKFGSDVMEDSCIQELKASNLFLTPTRVERLNVSDNSFSGDLPHRLFSLNDLTEFDVMENSCIQELKASNLVISPGEII